MRLSVSMAVSRFSALFLILFVSGAGPVLGSEQESGPVLHQVSFSAEREQVMLVRSEFPAGRKH